MAGTFEGVVDALYQRVPGRRGLWIPQTVCPGGKSFSCFGCRQLLRGIRYLEPGGVSGKAEPVQMPGGAVRWREERCRAGSD